MTRARRTERPPGGRARKTAGGDRTHRSSGPTSAVQERTSAAAPEAKRGGLLLGRYRLEQRIGAGATSTVWLGHDEHLDRPVAVKILHPHLLVDDSARARLEGEARTVARLSHPNVVGVLDALVTDDQAAVVLEHVPGEGLDDRLRRTGPLPPAVASRIVAELAAGLAAAHEAGIVHRDVKPANVLLAEDGRARLADFGIAQALDDEAAALTETGSIVGTLRYMAPERLEGQAPTTASDVWGLGAVLVEAITGRPPYPAQTPIELLEAARQGPPDLTGIPDALAARLRTMLAPEPSARPTAAQVHAMLAAIADSPSEPVAPIAALTPELSEAPTEALPIPAAAVSTAPAARANEPSSKPGAAAAVALAGLAAAGLFLGAIWATNPAESTAPVGGAPSAGVAPPTARTTPSPTLEPTSKPGKGHGKHGGGPGD